MKKQLSVFIALLALISIAQFAIAERDQPNINILDDIEKTININAGDDVSANIRAGINQGNLKDTVRAVIKAKIKEGNLTREEIKSEVERFRNELESGNATVEIGGERVKLHELNDKQIEMVVGKINARTGLNLTADDIGNGTVGSILRAYLSNGRFAEVKVMPSTASKRALEVLGAKCAERNCTVELKEVGRDGRDLNETDGNLTDGNETRIAYDVKTEKKARVLGVIGTKMKVEAQVDAETGEIIKKHKPWWAFLASEEDATPEEIEEDIS